MARPVRSSDPPPASRLSRGGPRAEFHRGRGRDWASPNPRSRFRSGSWGPSSARRSSRCSGRRCISPTPAACWRITPPAPEGLLREISQDFSVLREIGAGSVRIGASTSVGIYYLPPLLAEFSAKLSRGWRSRWSIENTAHIEERLLTNEFDLGFMGARGGFGGTSFRSPSSRTRSSSPAPRVTRWRRRPRSPRSASPGSG